MSHTIISASAGTGKTERLSHVVADALSGVHGASIDVEGLIAVTYTTKAEAELRSRIRTTLAKRGAFDEAQRLPLAYIGTVHGICNRLLEEFAVLAGLPPKVDVLPEAVADRAANEALEAALTAEEHERLDALCHRLRPNYDARFIRHKWVPDALDLLELARANQIKPKALTAMAERSIDGLKACLGSRRDDQLDLDAALLAAIRRTLSHLGDGSDTKATANAIAELKEHERTLTLARELPWATWLKLSKLSAAAAFRDVMADVNGAAQAHRQHPRFHDDIADYIRLVYRAVGKGLAEYAAWKTERRYIDYTDMEERALLLLDDARVRNELATRLRLLVVDEFQDTSPIQLALFQKLGELCADTVWVGDRKQSIFAFRGADPILMDATVDDARSRGGQHEILNTNYRSRAALVDFSSTIFASAFAPHGYRPEEVQATAARPQDDARMAALPPLGVFHIMATRAEQDAAGLAAGVRRLLEDPAATPVVDRATGATRDLRPSDIAILAATNRDALTIASALGELAIDVALPRRWLLETAEGTFLHAALRVVADERDTVAWSQLDALDGFGGVEPDDWLAEILERRAQDEPLVAKGPTAAVLAARERLLYLAPTEAVDELIGLLDLPGRAISWPRPEERLANLEALRSLASNYEDDVEASRAPGSIVGFLHFLEAAVGSGIDETGQDRSDPQHASGSEAVQLCTYHRSKGLEWPVVILSSLNAKSRSFGIAPDAAAMRLQRGGRSLHFSATPESDVANFDARAPLAGRWLRFWPWPYGEQKTADLLDAVAATHESKRLLETEMRESLRLLYVGFTRARDHLILAVRSKRTATAPKAARGKKIEPPAAPMVTASYDAHWLEAINDGKQPLVELPTGDSSAHTVRIASGEMYPARVLWLDPSLPVSPIPREVSRRWFTRRTTNARLSYAIAPSQAEVEWSEATQASKFSVTVHELGERIPFSRGDRPMSEAGDAVHAVFAADDFAAPIERRLEVADRILRARGFGDALRADLIIARYDALRAWLSARHPAAVWHREIPIVGHVASAAGARRATGTIDLLLELPTAYVLVDHKTYPGQNVVEQAQHHAPQLAAYRLLLAGTGKPVVETWLNFPVSGQLVEMTTLDPEAVDGRQPRA